MINVTSYYEEVLPAGDYVFRFLDASDYVAAITAENGGADSLVFKSKASDTTGFEDVDFIATEAYATILSVPFGRRLYVTLAGEETISFRIHRRPDA